ncbi:MAG: translocation/assembly module TamB domain-containing protein [Paludibacteraceae bacterium]|nr:translocation/assembly module TamB domain-containing protein [Paludibacteraceae bacterium]
MKRFAYIVSILVICSLMVVYMLSLLVRNGEVQTAAVRWLAAEVSQALGADVDVRHVEYRFFNTLHIDDIYISDRQGDTLAYVSSVDVQMRMREVLNRKISIRKIAVDQPYVNLHDDNYAFLLRALQNPDTTDTDTLLMSLLIDEVQVTGIRARMDTLLLRNADLHTGLLYTDEQSIRADLRSLHGTIYDYRTIGIPDVQPKSLFTLCDMQAELIATDSVIDMPRLYIRLPHSQLNSEVVHIDSESFALRLSDTYITGRDLTLLVPQVQRLDGQIGLSGALEGNADSVMLNELSVSYKGTPFFRGAATAYEWQDYDSLRLRAECQDLTLRAAMLQDFLADLLDTPYQLPQPMYRLGEMHYKGILEGRLRDMNLHGSFRTALGMISTNGHMQTNARFDDLAFNGAISTRRFRLGRLLGNSDLGAVTMNMQMNGHTSKDHPVHGHFRGIIQQLAYKGYTYSDLRLNGQFEQESIEGELSSNDPNIQLSLSGLVDLSENAPNINVTLDLRHLRLDALNLTDKLTDNDMRMKLYINFFGTDIDHVNGYLVIDSLLFANNGDTLNMRQLKITAESETDDPTQHNLKLESDYAVGRIAGHFSYSELGTSMQKMVVQYVPHLFDAQMRKHLSARPTATRATFYLYAHDLDRILAVLPTNISQSGSLTVKGMIDEPRQHIAVSGVVPELTVGNQRFSDIILSADNLDRQLNLRASAHIDLPDTLGIGDADLIMNVMAMNDSMLLTLNLSNDAEQMYGGQVGMLTTFAEYAGRPLITANIMPSELYIANTLWYVDPARITYNVADTVLQVDHLWMGNSEKYIFADGVASTHEQDSIHVRLKDIDLSVIMGLTPLPSFTLTAQGKITGQATMYGILSSLQLNADLHVSEAGLNGSPIGDMNAWAKLDSKRKAVEIGGDVTDNGRHVADLTGLITPMDDKTWSLHIYPDSFNLGFLNHWTKSFLHDITGRGSGHVHVFGRQKRTWVTIEAKPHGVSMVVPFTGVTYYVYDSIFMDSTAIRFPHHIVYDREKHPVRLDGVVNHTNFRDFTYDINMYADNATVLDLQNSSTAYYYGKVYATGDVRLFGDEKKVNLVAHAKSDNGSTFHLNIGGQSDAKENSFITFVDHSAPKVLTKNRAKRNPDNTTNLDLDLFVTVDQGTQFFTQFGNNSDDMLRGRGDGSMRVHLINSDLQLQGTLTLRQGSLNYALGNMVHRDFSISDGSSITWQGGPMDMNLDVTAKYHVVASLKDLFGNDLSSLQTNRTSVPVNCIIYLRDRITNPILSFGIELPQSDESVQSQVRSFINSDDMLMREVLYLLVFNRFFTPEYLRSTNSTGLNETYSLLSSTVTGQINSWLSKLTNIVTFGINFRTDGEGAEASQEYEAQFSIQPIDRLLINGNVGYRYNDLNNRPVFGDLDIEYIITPDGMLRVKGYTHTVDKYSLRQANMVEGVGFVVKHDFNWGDAFRNAEKKRRQKAEREAKQNKQ